MLDLMLSSAEHHHDHNDGGGLLDTLLRGLFWRTGTDAANSLFAAAARPAHRAGGAHRPGRRTALADPPLMAPRPAAGRPRNRVRGAAAGAHQERP